MDDLTRLANFAEIIGAAVVIGGIVFAMLQMRQLRQQRRELAAIELFRFFGSPQFTNAYREILQLPSGLTKDQMRSISTNTENNAMLIGSTMENIGVMMYQRIVPSAVVKNLMGTSATLLWHRLETWIRDLRVELENPGAFEWFQWLAETLEELQETDNEPAYEAHKDWKPSKLTHEI